MTGDLPPSSSETFFRLPAEAWMIFRPVMCDPVNATFDVRMRPRRRAGSLAMSGDDVHLTRRHAGFLAQLG